MMDKLYSCALCAPARTDRLFAILNRSPVRVPDRIYYWLLDRLTDNAGWRPLSYRERLKP